MGNYTLGGLVNYPPTCVSDKKSSMIGESGLAEWIVFYGEEDG
jgi:hypothetical protein